MAQRVQVILEDDIDGSTADETIRFGLDGVDYEIDLSEANAEKLRSDLAQWVGHARRLSRGRSTASAAGRKAGSPTEIRAWAQANGIEVNARGRVPASVREAYEAAVR
ncbi:Lsr2 family protein [Ammonicoccus fulvus]|uniref:Lsr2 family protein n=1 Tax=Ammonicoccus fulvus TaxID=3138240 RepID=A0ABZ3FPF7_9ACTN